MFLLILQELCVCNPVRDDCLSSPTQELYLKSPRETQEKPATKSHKKNEASANTG
jgi:hypothetical protein